MRALFMIALFTLSYHSLATETLRTKVLDNAGGDASFNETLTFYSKPLMHAKLVVGVYDKVCVRVCLL